jgi:hypothetical protein
MQAFRFLMELASVIDRTEAGSLGTLKPRDTPKQASHSRALGLGLAFLAYIANQKSK